MVVERLGVLCKKKSSVPEKLDELPYPAWHLFNMEGYWKSNVRTGGGNLKLIDMLCNAKYKRIPTYM